MSESERNSSLVEIRRITSQQTFPLRLSVLRPGRSLDSAQFPGDDAPSTRHFGAFRDGQLLGIASLFRAHMPEFPAQSAFQLRGMAVAREARRTGLGRTLTLACIAFARENSAQLLWCNARTPASGFYLKLGFQIVGEEFNIPEVGPHFRMLLRLAASL